MAFGRHWEWRGFGQPSAELVERIRSFPLLFATPQAVVDRYIWAPGCPVNLKLRFDKFKIKRLVDAGEGGVEEWLEDPEENYSFPLDARLFAQVAAIFGADRVSQEEALDDATGLLEALGRELPDLRVIEVDKLRWQHRGPPGTAAIIEYAEIRAPERCLSIGLEDEDPAKIRRTITELGGLEFLRTASYLEALELWGRGERVLGEKGPA